MQASSNSIESKLRQAWSQQRRFIHFRGLSRFVIWLIVMIAVDFIIDWGIVFRSRVTVNMGLLLLGINVAVLAWVLWHEWLRHLRPYNPLLVALEVESRHPELSSLLVSYTQLDDIKKNQPNVSADLVQAMQDHAVVLTKPLDFREIVDFGQLTRLFSVAAGVLLLFAVIGFSMPDHLRVLADRLTGGTTEYPTQTTIIAVAGDTTVRVGDSVALSATVEGIVPEAGKLYTKPADGSGRWQALPLRPKDKSAANETAVFARVIEELTQDVVFYVQIGDDQSEVHRVKVVPAPRIESSRVALVYPSYMGRAEGQSDQLNLEVPIGTDLQWTLACESAVDSVQVEVSEVDRDGQEAVRRIEAEILDGGTEVRFQTAADKALRYTFHWTVREDDQELKYDDVQYNVRVVADAIPDIELLRPSSSGLATVNKRLDVSARAADDHGLSQAWLVHTVTGDSEEKRVPIRNFQGAAGEQFAFASALGTLIEGLQARFENADQTAPTQVSIAVEVADLAGTIALKADASNNTFTAVAHELTNDQALMLTSTGTLPEPLQAGQTYWVTGATADTFQLAAQATGEPIALTGKGDGEHRAASLAAWRERTRRSATRQLTIVDDDRYMQWYRMELAAQHDEIKRAQAVEQVSSTKIKEIKVQEGGAE